MHFDWLNNPMTWKNYIEVCAFSIGLSALITVAKKLRSTR